MDRPRLIPILALMVAGGLYWLVVCRIAGVKEPWDGDAYWTLWYPVAIGLSAVTGYYMKDDGWLAGLIIIVSQFPVMWFNTGAAPLLMVALMFMSVLAVPAVAVSLLSGRLAMRGRSS